MAGKWWETGANWRESLRMAGNLSEPQENGGQPLRIAANHRRIVEDG
jgi:hypothetical protein